ncbi:MAG TPA: TolC family protein, partial [Terriglobales bacterium]|nr:TolC family protein [Terriglobales bacterium]
MRFSGGVVAVGILLTCVSLNAAAQEGLPFRRAIELALTHSSEMALSGADEARAYRTYLEARSSYIPQAAIGSDVGYAYGFPLSLEGSAPTLFNVTAQSSVFNPAQREFIRAAKAEWGASKAQSGEQRAQVIAETALTYIELSRWEERLPILRSEMNVVGDVQYAEAERVKAGLDSPLEQTKAKLLDAQTRVHIAEAEGAVDILRTRLGQLTGLPANSMQTLRDSIPVLSEEAPAGNLPQRAAEASPAVEAAQQGAIAKQFRAKGEHKGLYPTADFAGQYGVINTSLTNFEKFFVPGSFQPHNVTFGLVVRFPFLNSTQRARAQAADAEALRARKDAEQARNKASLDALKMQHNVQQLLAARDVAELRYELAQSQLD